jgi:DNA-directed RNA polymerase specialized sigma24 family protein
VELRYFGGLSIEKTAEVLGVSVDTAKPDWRMAKAWLIASLPENKTHELQARSANRWRHQVGD